MVTYENSELNRGVFWKRGHRQTWLGTFHLSRPIVPLKPLLSVTCGNVYNIRRLL